VDLLNLSVEPCDFIYQWKCLSAELVQPALTLLCQYGRHDGRSHQFHEGSHNSVHVYKHTTTVIIFISFPSIPVSIASKAFSSLIDYNLGISYITLFIALKLSGPYITRQLSPSLHLWFLLRYKLHVHQATPLNSPTLQCSNLSGYNPKLAFVLQYQISTVVMFPTRHCSCNLCYNMDIPKLTLLNSIALQPGSFSCFNVHITYVTPLMSSPREATSVAIRTFTLPVLKSSKACSRSNCSL